MDENENTEVSEPKSTFFQIAVCQSILALTVIAAALVMKFFFPGVYGGVKDWYSENIVPDTDISEIINGANNEV